MIAYWIDYAFYFIPAGLSYSSVRWRFPIMFQSFFTLLVMWGLLYLPDSPRWLMMRGRYEEAKEVLARLEGTDVDSEAVDIEMNNIKEALDAQSAGGGFKMKELFQNGPSQNFRRTMLGVAAQFFQQICGINLIVRPSDWYHIVAATNACVDLLRHLCLRELSRIRRRNVSSARLVQRHGVLPSQSDRSAHHRARWPSQANVVRSLRNDGFNGYPLWSLVHCNYQ